MDVNCNKTPWIKLLSLKSSPKMGEKKNKLRKASVIKPTGNTTVDLVTISCHELQASMSRKKSTAEKDGKEWDDRVKKEHRMGESNSRQDIFLLVWKGFKEADCWRSASLHVLITSRSNLITKNNSNERSCVYMLN